MGSIKLARLQQRDRWHSSEHDIPSDRALEPADIVQ